MFFVFCFFLDFQFFNILLFPSMYLMKLKWKSKPPNHWLMANVNRFSISLNPKLKKQQIKKKKHSFDSGPFTRQLSKLCKECFCTFDLKLNRKFLLLIHYKLKSDHLINCLKVVGFCFIIKCHLLYLILNHLKKIINAQIYIVCLYCSCMQHPSVFAKHCKKWP